MKKRLLLILSALLLIACSSDDQTSNNTNLSEMNNVVFYADGTLLDNDSILITVNYCCEKSLRIEMRYDGEVGRRDLLKMKMHKDGSVKNIDYFLYNQSGGYKSPFFKIPDNYLDVEVFDFDEELMQLNLKFTATLLRHHPGWPGPEAIEVDIDLDAKIVNECICTPGAQTMNDAYMELNPSFQFLYFSKGSTWSHLEPRLYNHSSLDVNGYRFILYSDAVKLEDLEVGVYELNAENLTPYVDFRKYIGEPHVNSHQIIPEEWEVYDINGDLEILEKLENGLNRIKIDFTASKDGEVIYEFSDANGLL